MDIILVGLIILLVVMIGLVVYWVNSDSNKVRILETNNEELEISDPEPPGYLEIRDEKCIIQIDYDKQQIFLKQKSEELTFGFEQIINVSKSEFDINRFIPPLVIGVMMRDEKLLSTLLFISVLLISFQEMSTKIILDIKTPSAGYKTLTISLFRTLEAQRAYDILKKIAAQNP